MLLKKRSIALILFCLLVIVYLSNRSVTLSNDTKANIYLSISLLKTGSFNLSAETFPMLHRWKISHKDTAFSVILNRWDDTSTHLYGKGVLQPLPPPYYVTPSNRPNTFINTFGIGASIVALPFISIPYWLDKTLAENPKKLWYSTKIVASGLSALAAVILFLIATCYLSNINACLIALAFGLGTGMWSTVSQGLWQHGPNILCLLIGIYCLFKIDKHPLFSTACGLSLAMAVLCRPGSVITAGCIGIYILMNHRNRLLYFVLGALPIAIGLLGYTLFYTGTLTQYAQLLSSPKIALQKTGNATVLQTPLLKGLAGTLLSPSRGLFIYSPFLIASFWGLLLTWKNPRYKLFKPLTIALILDLIITSKHFDWWSGWSFGPRHLLDTVPILCLLLIPIIELILKSRWKWPLLGLFLWSLIVQIIGAYAYTMTSWNNQVMLSYINKQNDSQLVPIEQQKTFIKNHPDYTMNGYSNFNIDRPEYQHRLWSLKDNQIMYYLTHFKRSHRLKKTLMGKFFQEEELEGLYISGANNKKIKLSFKKGTLP